MRTDEQRQHTKELVAALRSGKYKQGRSYLRRANNFCCLGVACDLAGEKWVPRDSQTDPVYDIFENGARRNGSMPYSVMVYYGFRDCNGIYGKTSLVENNDNEYKDFYQIANIIESEPKGLFNE